MIGSRIVRTNDGADDARNGGKDEAEGEAANTTEGNLVPAQGGVDDVGENRDHNDDGEGVEVGEEVVGGTIGGHGRALITENVTDTAVIVVPDGKVEEDRACRIGASGVVNHFVRPRDRLAVEGRDALGGKHARLCGVEVAFSPWFELVLLNRHTSDFEDIG